MGRPIAGGQSQTRGCWIGRFPDQAHHFVNIGDGNCQTNQIMTAFTSFVQAMPCTTGNHFFPEGQEGLNEAPHRQLNGSTTNQRQHIDAKRGLQLRIAIELVQHHFCRGVTLELNHDPHAPPIAFVA